MKLLLDLDQRTQSLLPIAALLLVAGAGSVDFLHGQYLDLTLLYLTPVAVVALLPFGPLTLLVALLGAAVAAAVAFYSGRLPLNLWVYLWNFIALFAQGLFVAWLLAALRQALFNEREAGRTDALTGVANSGKFAELAQAEMTRTARYQRPLTLAYLDIDNLRMVNEKQGHSSGDQLLRVVAQTIKETLRKTDLVTRIGGDEFAILLPETDQEAARVAVGKITTTLDARMAAKQWPVTFSVGVVTCTRIPPSLDNLIEIADSVMYTVKGASKNGVNFTLYDQRQG
jgi:diguanylate cyclase (GGDEF)-like protein